MVVANNSVMPSSVESLMHSLSGAARDERGRFLPGGRHLLPPSCQRPTLGRTWHVTTSRWDWCKECGAYYEGWGRQRYCSPRCRQRVNMRRYRARKRGTPSERRHYRLNAIPEGLHVVKRPYAEGLGVVPWWQQPDPGRAVLVPLTPELEDAIVRVMHPRSGYPVVSGYRAKLPLGWQRGAVAASSNAATTSVPNESEWERLLHDMLLGVLRRVS
jgi:hypothetical protein